jgi:phage FluMu gp28-like protein
MKGWTWTQEAQDAWEAKIRGAYGTRTAQMRQELDAIAADAVGSAMPRVVIERAAQERDIVVRYFLPDTFKTAGRSCAATWWTSGSGR